MAVIFPPWTNRTPRFVAMAVALVGVAVVLAVWYWVSPKYTDAGYAPVQPVDFSHKQHAGDLGMDCRYCHDTVEQAAHAAIPPTSSCMGCHERLSLPDSPELTLVRDSYRTGAPLRWVRVHMLPDYAYFDHGVHVAAGVGCSSCHGRVDQMKVVRQFASLSMSWCLTCHRDPNPELRPRAEVTNMAWDSAAAGYDPRQDISRRRDVAPPVYCSGCHR